LCPTGKGDSGSKKNFMDFNLFRLVFDQLKNSLVEVDMFNWGEPLLNKDLTKMIRYAKGVNKTVNIITSTNLNIDNNNLLLELLGSGIDKIIVSCDGAAKESYSKYRVGGDFDLVMKNLRFLSEKNKKADNRVSVVWNFIVFKHNEHEVKDAREMAVRMGVPINIGLMRTSLKDEILKPHNESIKKDREFIPDNPLYSAYDKSGLVTRKILKTCKKPWNMISVNSSGIVFPCCAVYEDAHGFGDVKKESIKNIWNNGKFVSARREILNKNLPESTICGACRNNGFMHM
jgi:radical SAM protein with 4Fe4S-binding SPASM domain